MKGGEAVLDWRLRLNGRRSRAQRLATSSQALLRNAQVRKRSIEGRFPSAQ